MLFQLFQLVARFISVLVYIAVTGVMFLGTYALCTFLLFFVFFMLLIVLGLVGLDSFIMQYFEYIMWLFLLGNFIYCFYKCFHKSDTIYTIKAILQQDYKRNC